MTAARWGGLATVAAGVLAMGAAEPPPLPVPPSVHDFARVMPARLYESTTTINGRPTPSYRTCLGGERMAQALADRPRPPARDPQEALKGCTSKTERSATGAMHLEMACDKAAGARSSFRMVSDIAPGMAEIRRHSEQAADPQTGRAAVVSDSRMVLLGDCPADLKPGEMLREDGTKVDALARARAREAGTPDAPKR